MVDQQSNPFKPGPLFINMDGSLLLQTFVRKVKKIPGVVAMISAVNLGTAFVLGQ